MIRENIVETHIRTLNNITVILSVSEESLLGIIYKAWRFFVSLRMTKNHGCHFDGGTTEKSPENRPAAQEISPCSRNDNKVYNDLKITIP